MKQKDLLAWYITEQHNKGAYPSIPELHQDVRVVKLIVQVSCLKQDIVRANSSSRCMLVTIFLVSALCSWMLDPPAHLLKQACGWVKGNVEIKGVLRDPLLSFIRPSLLSADFVSPSLSVSFLAHPFFCFRPFL